MFLTSGEVYEKIFRDDKPMEEIDNEINFWYKNKSE
jgi:hypothetical protein